VAFEPPVRVVPVHAKWLRVSASVMLFPAVPGVSAVTVTTAPEEVALTPTVGWEVLQAAIAAARFVAEVVEVLLSTNVPVVELVQLFEPEETAVSVKVFVDGLVIVTVPEEVPVENVPVCVAAETLVL